MKILIIILTTLLLVNACDNSPSNNGRGKDNYWFETKEYQKDLVTITLKVYPNKSALRSAAMLKGIDDWKDVQAFASLLPQKNKCTIHLVDPKDSYEPEYYGHELAHCIWGRFHEKQNQPVNTLGPGYRP
tara:strand:- start:13523 stop:13912 length:390 start_codon:yes stop_codon:yes gene_type:complete